MKQSEIFYFSSEEYLDGSIFFDGFAFFNIDLIVGQEGYKDFIKINKSHEMYADGNYVLIKKDTKGNIIISRDYHGYYPLYYFQDSSFWCISNSLKYLIEKLIDKNISLTLNEGIAEIWKSSLAFALQAATHETIASQVKLLPIDQDIIIEEQTNNRFILQSRNHEKSIPSYELAISNCLSIWNARYQTILQNDEIALHQDLTGGLDSRTLLSFLLSQKNLNSNFKLGNLKINSDKNKEEDFKVANNLGVAFGLELNSHISDKYIVERSNGSINYQVWENFNVGRYAPIIFPLTDFNPNFIELGGEGGEDNRPFYGKQPDGTFLPFQNYIDTYKKIFSNDSRYEQWRECILSSLQTVKENRNIDKLSDSILHYREFRSTHHTSKNPKSRFKFAVLGSKYFDIILQASPLEKINNGQVLYDIINSNYYKLLFLPFDSEYKAPTAENVLNISNIVYVKDFSNTGKVFSSKNYEYSELLISLDREQNKYNHLNGLQILINKSKESLAENQDLINNLFGSQYIESVNKKLNDLDFNTKSLNLHSNGSYLHTLRLADLISKFY